MLREELVAKAFRLTAHTRTIISLRERERTKGVCGGFDGVGCFTEHSRLEVGRVPGVSIRAGFVS